MTQVVWRFEFGENAFLFTAWRGARFLGARYWQVDYEQRLYCIVSPNNPEGPYTLPVWN